MSIGMSLALTKTSPCINNLHVIGANSKLGSRSKNFDLQNGFQYYLGSSKLTQRRRAITVRSSIQPVLPPTPPPIPPPSSAPSSGFPGKGWIAGIILSLVLPFLTNKWGPLFLFKKDGVEQKLQRVEDLAEMLEKVADRVQHLAGDVGKDLPEGPYRKAANMIEDAAGKIEAVAHLTDATIDKIQELEDEVESVVKSEKVKATKLEEENTSSSKQA